MTLPLGPSPKFKWVDAADEIPFHKVKVIGCESPKTPGISCYYNHRQMGWYNMQDERIQIVSWQKVFRKEEV